MSDWKREIRKRLASLRLEPTREAAIVEELAQDLEDCHAALIASGLDEAEARRQTLAELKNSHLLTRELQRGEKRLTEPIIAGSNRRTAMISGLWQDLRFGARKLRKQPGFAAIVVFTLALGIGANTMIFSVVNAALLRKLPYDATRMVSINSFNPQKQKSPGGISPADYVDWRAQSQTFEYLTAYSGGGGIGLKEGERTEIIDGTSVAPDFFATFGVQPLLGRTFSSEEEVPNGPQAIILSHRLWQQRFGGDPQIIGRTLKTGDGPMTVVGVMPPEFKFPRSAQIWTPLSRYSGQLKYRANRYFNALGRLRDGQTIQTAQAEMDAIAARLAAAYPKENTGWTVRLSDWRSSLVRDSRNALLVLMGAVGFVLLIACANVANLLLTAAAARRKEMAVRLALGASRRTLVRQLLAENVMLALLGGAFGLMLAVGGISVLTGLLPELNFTYQSLSQLRNEIRIDRVVLLFTLSVSLLTGLIFGLAPAWQASNTHVGESLKDTSRGNTGGHQRTRFALVVAEVALALVLLVGAGLLISSFSRMLRVDPGYDPTGLMVMSLSFPAGDKYVFAQRVMERIAATPGVTSVALMGYPTLGGLNFSFNRPDKPLAEGDVTVAYSAVSPGYLTTLKTPLLAGRAIDERDLPGATPIALINQTMARQYFAGEDPVGQKLVLNYFNQPHTREIVGVVGDVRQDEPSKPTKAEILVPYAQLQWFSASLLVRTANADPMTMKNDVQQAIWTIDRGRPEARAEALTKTLAGQVAEPRLYAMLLGLFAGIALLLAAVGIYSVIAYAVTQRTHEIGVRMALGAQGADVLRMAIGEGLRPAAIGIAIGILISLALTRTLKTLLFGISATDPMTFAGISLLLMIVAVVACLIPARRATKVDPLTALRHE